MKKVIKEYRPEESIYYCDKHTDRECFSELQVSSWYGSKFDMNVVKVHLCDECVQKIYKFLKKEFKAEPKEIEI